MIKTIKTHQNVIEHFGGVGSLATLLAGDCSGDYEQQYHKVLKWNKRNKIPSTHWAELIDLAQHQDLPLTLKQLTDSQ